MATKPNGLVIQWETDTTSGTYGREITMPTTFNSSSTYTVVCVRYNNADYDDTSCTVYKIDGQTFKFNVDGSQASYIAIGY